MTAVAEFWGENVLDGPFESVEKSMTRLKWRAEMFPALYELMPVEFPGKTVLDFGCGPGHDTVLFAMYGAKVWYCDISAKARLITEKRLRLHGLAAFGFAVEDGKKPVLPMVDHIHCAGVLHHTSAPHLILRAFRESLNPGGTVRVMCYDGALSPHTQSEVPVTLWWTPAQMLTLASRAGLTGTYEGSYPCSSPWRPDCYAACYAFHAE